MTTSSHKRKSHQDGGQNVPEHKGMINSLWRPLAVTALFAMAGSVGAANIKTPYRVSSDCMICHGSTGHNTIYSVVPRLAGQHKSYLEAQLKAYRDGTRADQNGQFYMWPVAQALGTAKITALATYFASQKPPMQGSGVKHAGIAQGKQIFSQGIMAEQIPACMECHGADGQGAGPFPRVAGQRYQYMVQQLTYFHNGTRVNTLMNQIVKLITKAQIKAVAAYMASL
ncbi:MAG: c-type cytochrome [Acidiferrobacter sp.]